MMPSTSAASSTTTHTPVWQPLSKPGSAGKEPSEAARAWLSDWAAEAAQLEQGTGSKRRKGDKGAPRLPAFSKLNGVEGAKSLSPMVHICDLPVGLPQVIAAEVGLRHLNHFVAKLPDDMRQQSAAYHRANSLREAVTALFCCRKLARLWSLYSSLEVWSPSLMQPWYAAARREAPKPSDFARSGQWQVRTFDTVVLVDNSGSISDAMRLQMEEGCRVLAELYCGASAFSGPLRLVPLCDPEDRADADFLIDAPAKVGALFATFFPWRHGFGLSPLGYRIWQQTSSYEERRWADPAQPHLPLTVLVLSDGMASDLDEKGEKKCLHDLMEMSSAPCWAPHQVVFQGHCVYLPPKIDDEHEMEQVHADLENLGEKIAERPELRGLSLEVLYPQLPERNEALSVRMLRGLLDRPLCQDDRRPTHWPFPPATAFGMPQLAGLAITR